MKRGEEVAANAVRRCFHDLHEILSAYLYGSILTNTFSRRSDVDVLFIVKEMQHPHKFIQKLKRRRERCRELKLDLNVVFYDEFLRRWHIYRPPTFFIGIKMRHLHLWGRDLLRSVRKNEASRLDVYQRFVGLAQGSRAVYLNGKDTDFWSKKYLKWLRTAVLELLYVHNAHLLDFHRAMEIIRRDYPELTKVGLLLEDDLKMEALHKIAEELRVFAYLHLPPTSRKHA